VGQKRSAADRGVGLARLLRDAPKERDDPPKALGRGTGVADDHDFALYRIPASGGEKVQIMQTFSVKHIAASARDIFVLSSCGLQQAPL